MSNSQVNLPGDRIAAFCRRPRVWRLSLFGSALREGFGPDSDVDFLVAFEPEHHMGYLGLAGIELELTSLIGRKADLRTPQEISPHFRHLVRSAAEVQYDRGRSFPTPAHA